MRAHCRMKASLRKPIPCSYTGQVVSYFILFHLFFLEMTHWKGLEVSLRTTALLCDHGCIVSTRIFRLTVAKVVSLPSYMGHLHT